MAVLEPLKVVVENYPHSSDIKLSVANFPTDESKGFHEINFSKVVYIDATDFQENPTDKSYKRLSLSQPVGLRHTGYQIAVKEVKRNADGTIVELVTTCTKTTDQVKPKGVIQWVSMPVKCEIRLFEKL